MWVCKWINICEAVCGFELFHNFLEAYTTLSLPVALRGAEKYSVRQLAVISLQYRTLQSLNWKQVQWGNCTGVFWQMIHWIWIILPWLHWQNKHCWDVNASTSGVQSRGESAPQLPRQQNFTDSAWKPTGGASKVDSHCNYSSKDKAAARKELTRRDQSCGNITESQRSDHAPAPRLNS